ncbi:hypothetical protein QE152_g29005 [Popillia japonica]|uniref:Uncharacterized protein n=1 Tax=Popillia japonica TaxID=7064 RepID=A0AAW1JID4_POPJA
MKLILYLTLIYLVLKVETCKSSSRPKEPFPELGDDDEENGSGTGGEGEEGEEGEEDGGEGATVPGGGESTTTPQPLTVRHSLVYCMNLRSKQNGTGVRILPYVVLTSTFMLEDEVEDVQVRYMNDEGQLDYLNVSDIESNDGDSKLVVIVCKRPTNWKTVHLNTFPIATKTNSLARATCYVIAVNYTLNYVANDEVILVTDAEECRQFPTTCVKPKRDKCCNIDGSSLMCNARVAGILWLEQNQEKKDYFIFSNVRYFAKTVIDLSMERFYHEYDVIDGLKAYSPSAVLLGSDTVTYISLLFYLYSMTCA